MSEVAKARTADSAREGVPPYGSPRLVVYGSLADITRAVGTNSVMDGGSVNGMKNSQA